MQPGTRRGEQDWPTGSSLSRLPAFPVPSVHLVAGGRGGHPTPALPDFLLEGGSHREQKNWEYGSLFVGEESGGTSLAVQWVRHRAPNAGGPGFRSLLRGLEPTCRN